MSALRANFKSVLRLFRRRNLLAEAEFPISPEEPGFESWTIQFEHAPEPADIREGAGGKVLDMAAFHAATSGRLPDPRLIRAMIERRRLRGRYFEETLFTDAAWDMLLNLAAARTGRFSLSSALLCRDAGVPMSVGRRWIGLLIEKGLIHPVEPRLGEAEGQFTLTAKGLSATADYFAELEERGLLVA